MTSCTSSYLAEHFNESAAALESKPDLILQNLKIKPGMVILDLGSGGGYFSFRFAESVGPEGRIHAADVNNDYLQIIEKERTKRGLRNISTVTARTDGVDLPAGTIDLIFIRNVFHHLPDRAAYFRRLARLLKPAGRIALIEYKEGGFFSRQWGHNSSTAEIIKTMSEAGYEQKENLDFLPEQSFLIFALRHDDSD